MVLTHDDAMLEDTFRGPQPLPVVYSWIMDAANWPLVAVLVAILVSMVLLAITCLHCRDEGPMSEKMSLLMLDCNRRWFLIGRRLVFSLCRVHLTGRHHRGVSRETLGTFPPSNHKLMSLCFLSSNQIL